MVLTGAVAGLCACFSEPEQILGSTGGGSQGDIGSVEISPPTVVAVVGDTLALSATVRDRNGVRLERPVRWGSTDTLVANITSTGVVAGTGVGTAIITATVEDTFGRANVIIRPSEIPIVAGDPTRRRD